LKCAVKPFEGHLEDSQPAIITCHKVDCQLRPDKNGNPRFWEESDGEKRASFELTAQTVKFLGKGTGSEGEEPVEEEDEIPF
jgi:hypothetical protein